MSRRKKLQTSFKHTISKISHKIKLLFDPDPKPAEVTPRRRGTFAAVRFAQPTAEGQTKITKFALLISQNASSTYCCPHFGFVIVFNKSLPEDEAGVVSRCRLPPPAAAVSALALCESHLRYWIL